MSGSILNWRIAMVALLTRRIWNRISRFLLSPEPDWYWGLFGVLFSLITMRYVYNKDISRIYSQIYYALPLFEFFHIPDPWIAKDMIEQYLSITFSLTDFFNLLRVVVIGSLFFSALGLFFQRFFIALSLISFFLFQGYLYGFVRTEDDPYVYHSANIVVFILLIWFLSPTNPRWKSCFWIKRHWQKGEKQVRDCSVYPQWPRLLIILTMGISYFGSFYCKFVTSGFQWINGHTLQHYLLLQSQTNPLSHGYWLATQSFFIIRFLNIGIWVFQSTAPIGFFMKKTRLLYGVMGALFHSGVFIFFGFPFIPFQWFFVILIPEATQFLFKIKSLISIEKFRIQIGKVWFTVKQ